MTTLAAPTYFHSWLQKKSGDGEIQTFDNGTATIRASAGSEACLYTSVQLYPGETVEFSCNCYASTGKGSVSIQAKTLESGVGDENKLDALKGDKNNKGVSVKYTAPLNSNECILVFFKLSVPTNESGSMTVMDPKFEVYNGVIGTARTNAAALIELHGGNVSLSSSYMQTGIQEVNLVADPNDASIYNIEVVIDPIVAINVGGKGIYPLPTVSKWVSVSQTTNGARIGVVSYNSLSRRVYLGFSKYSDGSRIDARALYQCNLVFESKMI